MSFEKLLLAALLVMFAGCTSQVPSVRIRTAGGERVTVDMARGGAIGPESKDLRISNASFLANAQTKKGIYAFVVDFKTDTLPRSIKVEDVSDEKARTLVNDTSPKVLNRNWRFACTPMSPDDANLKWVHEIDESFRVYRFTISLADGREVMQYHATYVPTYTKAFLRHELGIDAP